MRLGHVLLFLTAFTLAFGAVPAKKAAPAKKSAGTAPRKTAPNAKSATRTSTARRGTRAAAPESYRATHQQSPSLDRYREIQQALADRGYLKSEPTGVWGPESVDALKQFQQEKNLQVTGKLNSLSLIGLGLGPKTAGPLVMPSPASLTPAAEPVSLPPQPQP